MATWEYPCDAPVDVHVEIAAGTVGISGEPTDLITVHAERTGNGWPAAGTDELTVSYAGGRLTVTDDAEHGFRIRRHGYDVKITVPAGSRCTVRSGAADVGCDGDFGALDVRTSAGDVRSERVDGPADLHTASGEITLDEASGTARLETGSGEISVRRAGGDVVATTASGDIAIGTAEGSVTARSASGTVRVARVSRGATEVSTASGDIEVLVAPGIGVRLDLSTVTGRVTSDLEPAGQDGPGDLRLTCRAVTGSVHVASAA